jgi:hypothetical protein
MVDFDDRNARPTSPRAVSGLQQGGLALKRYRWPERGRIAMRVLGTTIVAVAALLLPASVHGAAGADDAAWKATSRDVVKGLGRCYTEPRHKQSWRLSGDRLVWETQSTGRVKVDRRAEVPVSVMQNATLDRSAGVVGYPYLVAIRLDRPVTAAATVSGQVNPDFNYETATLSCALRKEPDASRLADAINRLIALAKGRPAQ